MRSIHPSPRFFAGCGLWLAAALIGGCAKAPPPNTSAASATSATPLNTRSPSHAATPAPKPPPGFVPVVRQGRYTLVELAPESAQKDLLQQVIEVSVPDARQATVGDGLRHVLLHSGYRLCQAGEVTAFDTLPLPAAHYRLGPVLLRDALLTLAGPTWELRVDDAARSVCFSRAGSSPAPAGEKASKTPDRTGTSAKVPTARQGARS